jgi:lipopolysaccharide/colanic/teichoic acid biosynthesis glycosyltransferase
VGNFYSVKEFRAILERECSRSDRTGDSFSIVVFQTSNINIDQPIANRLAKTLSRRLRSIDEVGWLDAQSIGIVLPKTSADNARKLANDISHKIGFGKDPVITIYEYPSDWLPRFEDNSSNTPEKNNCDKGNLSGIQAGTVKMCNSGSLAERFEGLFHCRMPVWKRTMDILGSGLGLVLLFPLLLSIAILIKIVSPGPVFYKGERIGYCGKPFKCWKFRTMHAGSHTSAHEHHVIELMKSDNAFYKLDNDDLRIIPFGILLRKTGLDELPQLINVLRGEMSLVGPRPELPYSVLHYTQWQKRRFDAVPGLTGLWQVNGKNRTTFKRMIRWDINYIQRRSFWLDFKVLVKTVPAIVMQALNSSSKKGEQQYARLP